MSDDDAKAQRLHDSGVHIHGCGRVGKGAQEILESDEGRNQLAAFAKRIRESQRPLDPEAVMILRAHLWDLYL